MDGPVKRNGGFITFGSPTDVDLSCGATDDRIPEPRCFQTLTIDDRQECK
jgi:hypothetical protein